MATKFMIGGNTVHVFNLNDETALDALPPKVYTVAYSQFQGFFLKVTKEKLELPEKIYGIAPQRVQKCIDTYNDRTASTGILLTGDKGTGKTLLMSLLANEIIEQLNMPVILIQDPHTGSEFTSFIEQLGECALVFDEFGKMYSSSRHNDSPQQTELLSLMDGVDKTKRMFILTENSEFDINDFMLNRPSRIYYHFKYHKLDEGSITGYSQDKMIEDSAIQDIIDLSRRSRVFSFDMLQTIVEEHLRYGTSITDVTKDLNIDLREEAGAMIEILKVVDRATEEECELFETAIVSKPEGRHNYTYVKVKSNTGARGNTPQPVKAAQGTAYEDAVEEADDKYNEVYIESDMLKYEDTEQLVYETEEYIFVAKNVIQQRTNYLNLF